MLLWLAACLSWFAVVLFMNPFMAYYNYGDAAFHAQVLHNLSHGLGLEQSTHYLCNDYLSGNPYFFASVLSVGLYWLPMVVLTPLYALYPYPPMHIYAVAALVYLCGTLGVYTAVRAMGGGKLQAGLWGVAFTLLPQVEYSSFCGGYFDNLGYAVLPFLFAALFARRWGAYYLCTLLLCAINIPYTYYVLGLGVVVGLWFGERVQGVITVLIGYAMLQVDWFFFERSLSSIRRAVVPTTGLFQRYVVNADLGQLAYAVGFYVMYVLFLLLALAFLPLYGVTARTGERRRIVGLTLVASCGLLMALFRSYGWEYHRSATMTVPILMAAALSYIACRKNREGEPPVAGRLQLPRLLALLLPSALITVTVWTSWLFPWAGLGTRAQRDGLNARTLLTRRNDTLLAEQLLKTVAAHVPADAAGLFRQQKAGMDIRLPSQGR